MEAGQHFDLRGRSVEETSDFLFAHAVPSDPKDPGWWWKVEILFDPAEHAAHLTTIFQNAGGLLSRYAREQLEQGFWLLISGVDAGLNELIWNSRVGWPARARLIESTVDLYANLFAVDPLDTAAHMFWDALAYDYGMPGHFKMNFANRRIQNAMFGALQKILEIASVPCQRAALHGLGHLRHPEGASAIATYLHRHPELSDEDREYALQCASGNIQ